ncbi:hypothetical protein MOV76_06890 [Rhizobium sp. PRIMUS64]|uniref:hypothetical protein n=1 Tax=Rhizobium sp. PRIMUS64 TaxID=2908925 RepID=UPI001FF6133F|nr:hypothetical protein [Rhizobium sp. PRIMUS64]MCJ9691358.1 hypothetical protein [Rhizobium sp. PRIMUS64]
MTYDFKSSLAEGLESGALATRNNDAINDVIDEFARQIFEGTDEQVIICRALLYDIGGYITHDPDEPGNNVPSFEAIVARPPGWEEGQEDSEFILAELARGERGFPCTVICDGYEFQCDDPEALQEALGELISLASTGEILNHLRNPGESAVEPSRRPL